MQLLNQWSTTTDEQLGPAKDLYAGRNSLWRLVLSHGGKWSKGGAKDTTFLVIGNRPGRAKVNKADEQKIPLITYGSHLSLIEGKTKLSELRRAPRPEILAFSDGWGPSLCPLTGDSAGSDSSKRHHVQQSEAGEEMQGDTEDTRTPQPQPKVAKSYTGRRSTTPVQP